jgi:DNA-directed RNA polymerase specialized sigma subunit
MSKKERDAQILVMLKDRKITYREIGQKFGLTRERVRQIREELIKKGEQVAQRGPVDIPLIQDLQNPDLSFEEVQKRSKMTSKQIYAFRSRKRKRGFQFPIKRKTRASKFDTIIAKLKTDEGRKYGQLKRIAQELRVTHQYVANTKCLAKKKGLL